MHGFQYREVIENVEIFAYLGKIRTKDKPTTDMKVEDMEDISFLKNIDLQTIVKLSLSIKVSFCSRNMRVQTHEKKMREYYQWR